MKIDTLYICGDSFCTVDPEYGPCWVDLLIEKLPNIKVVNLAIPGASNYLIQLQVKQALEEKCDYLIYHATSSIRQEFSISDGAHQRDSIDRYWSPTDRDHKSVMCNSWLSPNRYYQYDSNENTIRDFFLKHIDFVSLIEKNYIFINYTLDKISNSNFIKNWIWSPGGFEHPKFNDTLSWNFDNYKHYQSSFNLWDEYDRNLTRPYYHVTNKIIHQKVCDSYLKMLQL